MDLDSENGRVVFDNLDPLVTTHGLTRMPHTAGIDVKQIHHIILAAAHFRRYADLAIPDSLLRGKVELQFMELCQKVGEYDEDLYPVFKTGKNLNHRGEVRIDEDGKKMYGFKIINKSSRDLFPYLFYFDNSDFGITVFYLPPSAGRYRNEPPLRRKDRNGNGVLHICSGSAGECPRGFSLPKNQNVDVGFLKLFLSTEYIDYTHISQHSPFTGIRVNHYFPVNSQIWDSMKVTVIQKKGFIANNW